MSLKLSVLDLAPVVSGSSSRETFKNTLQLAKSVDALGFNRYWLAEHHSMLGIASSAPEILIGHVASVTKHLRVGSGGIMLPNHSALKVAETFHTLESLHPGRIDLGLGRAPGTNSRTALALRGLDENLHVDHFPRLFSDLTTFLTGSFPEGHPFQGVIAMPEDAQTPEIFILGSSDFGARFAAEHGLGFAFAHHFSSLPAEEVMALYQRGFRPSIFRKKPYAILATNIVAAESAEEADMLSIPGDLSFYRFRQTGKSAPMPTLVDALKVRDQPGLREVIRRPNQSFVGEASAVAAQVSAFAEKLSIDEVMITTMVPDQEARIRSYRLLAERFGLEKR
ncbi:MAG: LLM class flavin-dependent oxidoreductase [Cryobacterium sp.]|nr:LLM class flavin-dependent oxidoreductase [Oligoflexia bacterium]